MYDLREAGASLNGKSDDTSAWATAIARANQLGIPVWHPGGNSLAQVVYPAGQQTRIFGPGPGLATITGSVSLSHSHVSSEWDCALAGMTVNGNAGAGTAVQLSRPTKFFLDQVRVTNNLGTGVAFISGWDGLVVDLFLSGTDGLVGVTAPPLVWDTVGNEDCVQNRTFGIHVEPGDVTQVYVDYIGTGTGKVRYNKSYATKIDGVPTTSGPTTSLLRLQANAVDNSLWGGDVAYGKGAPQITVAGDRNLIAGFESVVGATPPTKCLEFTAGNDNQVFLLRTQSTAYTDHLFSVAGGCSRTLFNNIQFPDAMTNVIDDQGFATYWHQPQATRRGLVDGANVAINAAQAVYQDLVTAAARNFSVPTNPVDGMELELTVQNTSGAPIIPTASGGTDGFSLVGGAWPAIGAGKCQTLRHRYVRYARTWREIARTAGDV
jgi:hypothetical protein